MAGRYCEGKIKMASEKVSRKMVLEIKYVNANNASTTAAVKAETVSQTRIVQMIELVFIWLCQQGLEEKECSPAE